MTERAGLRLELEATITRFEQQMRKAVSSGTVTATTLEKRFDTMNTKMANSSRKAAAGLGSVVNVSRQGRFVMQNTAAQLGDIAVQLESGTDGMRVMGQQLPQILGGFGALSGTLGIVAPLLSVIAAVGFPIAAMLIATGVGAEEADEKVKGFAERLTDAESALRSAEKAMQMASGGGIDDLREKYGAVTLAVSELAASLAEIEKRAAQQELKAVFDVDELGNLANTVRDALGGEAGFIASVVIDVDEESIQSSRDLVRQIETDLAMAISTNQPTGLLEQQLVSAKEELAILLGQMENAGSLAEKLGPSAETIARVRGLQQAYRDALSTNQFEDAANAIRSIIKVAEDLGVTLDDEMNEKLVKAESLAREFAHKLDDGAVAAAGVANAAGGIASPIYDANNAAVALTGNLQNALAVLAAVTQGMVTAQRSAQQRLQIKLSTVGQPVKRAGALAKQELFEKTGSNPDAFDPRNPSTKPLRDAASKVQDNAEQIASAEASLRAAEKVFADSVKPVKGAKSAKGGSSGRARKSGSRRSGRTERDFFETSEREITQLQRRIEMIGKTDAEIAKLTLRHKLLDEAKRRGIDLDKKHTSSGQTLRQEIDRQADSVGNLTAKYQQAEERAQLFENARQTTEDGIINSIVEAENLSGALEEVAKSFARATLQALLFNKGPLAKQGGGSGLLGNVLTTIFGGFRADGGSVSSGKGYIVGERGPEWFMPPTSGTIVPNHALGGGGAQNVHVTVGIEADSGLNIMPVVKDVSQQEIGRAAPQIQSAAQRNTLKYMSETTGGWG